MMEVYKTPSEETRDILLANVLYAEVIEGLNGYFTSDPRNNYITICRYIDNRKFYLYDPEKWVDILISWLRAKHGIFYYPGMESNKEAVGKNIMNYMRQEPSRYGFDLPKACQDLIDDLKKREEEIRNLNAELATKWTKTSLIDWLQQRARHKGVELDDIFLYSDDTQYDWTDIADFLFDEIVKMRGEIENLTETNYKDIMDYIRKEASRNGFDLPEEIDGEPLTIKRVFHDLLELLRKKEAQRKAVNEQLKKDTDYVTDTFRDILEALGISKSNTAHLDIPGLKTKALQRASCIKVEHDRYQEQLGKATADYKALSEENQKLKTSQKPDTNKLIRDCCVKYNVVAPSRYLSDEACVEYVFSLLDSYSKQRNKAYDDRDRAVDDYKLSLKDYILHDIKKRGYRYDGLETKSIEDIVDWIITMATCAGNADNSRPYILAHLKETLRNRSINFDKKDEKDILKLIDILVLDRDYACDAEFDLGNTVQELDQKIQELEARHNSDRYVSDRIRSSCKAHGVVIDAALHTTSDWQLLVTFLCEEIRKLKKEVEDAKKEAKRECYWYLWGALRKLSPECDALKIDRYEDLVDRIFYEMSLINGNCKRCQRKHSTEKFDYIRRANKAEEEVKELNDVIKKLNELLNEINKKEDEGWFKP